MYSNEINPRTKRDHRRASHPAASSAGRISGGPPRRERPVSINSGYIVFGDPAWTVRQVQCRHRRRSRRRRRYGHHQRPGSESEAVHRSRRQADRLPRVERPADFAVTTPRCTTSAWSLRSAACEGQRFGYRLFLAPGHGALQRRRRSGHVRCGRGDRAVGRTGHARRIASSRRTPSKAWSIARVRSAHIRRSPLYGQGQPRRCGELRVQGAVA